MGYEILEQTCNQVQAAIVQFIQGEPDEYKACWSQSEDVTIMGAWGAYERGWQEVGPRLDWAAARFAGGRVSFELVALGESGDGAYSIWLEKNMSRLVGQQEAQPFVLRVTHLYRREAGRWKVIHRHADPIIDKIEAVTILPQEE